MLYSVILLFLPSILVAVSAFPSSPPHIAFDYDYQLVTQLQTAPESNTTTTDNTATITFVIPEIRINYSSSWEAFPGIPQSPYVDSIVTFRLLPQNKTDSNLDSSTAILNIARHSLFDQVIESQEYVGTQLYFLRNTIPGFKLLQSGNTTLDGRPA